MKMRVKMLLSPGFFGNENFANRSKAMLRAKDEGKIALCLDWQPDIVCP